MAEEIIVVQGTGTLKGEVRVSGAKNSALKLIAAAADSSFLLLALLQPENPVFTGFSGYVYMCTVSYLRLAQTNQQ